MGRLTDKITSFLTLGGEKVRKITGTSPAQRTRKPVVLSRDKHPISRKYIDRDALKVLYRLHNHGYQAYLVGGSVRDFLLGKKPKDFDVGTDASPREIKRLFGNSLIIGRRFRIVHIRFKGNKIIEVTTFRRKTDDEASNGDAPTIRDNTFGTTREDAFRRDITINGLFYNIADFSIIDYVGGLRDLEDGIIRIIGDPKVRFSEDPVRMIRVIRHAARTGFTISESTSSAIKEMYDKIGLCPPARIGEELLKDLKSGKSKESFRLFSEYGILKVLFPSIQESIDKGKITEEFLLSSLGLLDALIGSKRELSTPFLFSVPMFPAAFALADEAKNKKDGGYLDIPQLIQRHLVEYSRQIGISKKNIDTMKQLFYLTWKMLKLIERGSSPFHLRKKVRNPEVFELLGLVSRAYGHFPDATWPPANDNSDPIRRLLRPPAGHRSRRRRQRKPVKNSP